MKKVQHLTLEILSYVGMFVIFEIHIYTFSIEPKNDGKNSSKLQFRANLKVKFKN